MELEKISRSEGDRWQRSALRQCGLMGVLCTDSQKDRLVRSTIHGTTSSSIATPKAILWLGDCRTESGKNCLRFGIISNTRLETIRHGRITWTAFTSECGMPS